MKKLKLTGISLTMLIVLAGCFGVPAATTTSTSRPAAAPTAALGPDELDETIREASDYINNNVPAGSFIVILNIQSSSAALSDYIIDELIANAVNDKNFSVVDRQRLDEIRKEQNFQTSGEVDDDQALSIGRFIGAQSIVTGSVSTLGSRYRITVRALDVETAKVQAQFNKNIAAGETIVALMQSGGGGTAAAAAGRQTTTASGAAATAAGGQTTTAAAATASGGTTAQPVVQPPAIAYGTYTFFPRPRAMKAGVDIDAYLDKIVVRDGYFIVYLTTVATGERGGVWNANPAYTRYAKIQDLDRPSRNYAAITSGWTDGNRQSFFSFENIECKKFRLYNDNSNPNDIFEEINLDNALFEPGFPPAAPARQITLQPIQNGKYFFFPRPRAMKAGVDLDAYLDRIEVRSGYLTIYLTTVATGDRGGVWNANTAYTRYAKIQDLDRPSRNFTAVRSGWTDGNRQSFFTFQDMTARRFRLYNDNSTPNDIFLEINLDNAEYEP